MPIKAPTSPTRIVLTGFMGAGKSTVGRLLAEQLGWRFLDVDDAIVQKAGMPVGEIFAKYGEFVFRRMEKSAIAHALGEHDAVVALGGGAVEVLANRLLLEQTPRTTVVFLDAALPVLLARCENQPDAAERPNLRVAEERFRYRAPLYRRVARLRLETADHSPQETVTELRLQLGIGAEIVR
ncbi:MAG: shikimate kinase [Terriglobus roseus]|nr:shikimate kinase [Terriglobus roseus]